MKILKATIGKLFGWGELSREKGTTNLEAYLKYFKASALAAINEPSRRLARQMLEEAIANKIFPHRLF